MAPTALLLLALQGQPAAPTPGPSLEHVRTIATAAPGAEIVSVQASTARAALTHSRTGEIELFDLSDPAAPRSVHVFELGLEKGEEITSVALPPSGEWFLVAVKAGPQLAPGRALAHSLADGERIASFPCGVGPDCVAIAPSGTQALIANEGEGFDSVEDRLVSARGGLTHIRLAPDLRSSKVTQIVFDLQTSQPTDGRTLERRVDEKTVEVELLSAPEYFEPEVVAFQPGEERALVTLQEINLVAYVDLAAGKLERYVPLGTTTHAADLVSDEQYAERDQLVARREPDGLALTPDGACFVTADEGDTGPGVADSLPGKPVAGGRTLSVFDLETGELLGDTGPELDRMAARAGLYPDKRSPRKGSEPEMVIAFERGGRSYAAVTLERAGALALVDLSNPRKPTVLAVVRSGDDHLDDEPEGLALFRDPEGGHDYFYVANEGTGTLGVLRVPR
jgi:hypothetical protein